MFRLSAGLCLSTLAACAQPAPEPRAAPADAVASRPAAEPAPDAPEPRPVSATPTGEAGLTAEGWGPLRIGMSRAEITRALGEDAAPKLVGGPKPERCDQYRPERAPDGMLLMVENGRLSRISLIRDAKVRTDRGVGLGATTAEVSQAYGPGLRASPHKYVGPPATYLDVWTGGPRAASYVEDAAARGIRYEVGAEGRVTMIHAGGPSIQYVEGCA